MPLNMYETTAKLLRENLKYHLELAEIKVGTSLRASAINIRRQCIVKYNIQEKLL
jgi:hypothetical protein